MARGLRFFRDHSCERSTGSQLAGKLEVYNDELPKNYSWKQFGVDAGVRCATRMGPISAERRNLERRHWRVPGGDGRRRPKVHH